jgi:hypothetical protein
MVSRHAVQFYESDHELSDVVASFLRPGLYSHAPCLVIATEPHRYQLARRLEALGLDLARVFESRQLVFADAAETLETFLVRGMPDERRFREHVGRLLDHARMTPGQPVRVCCEMADVLWKDGKQPAALALEELWSRLGTEQPFALLCAYAAREHGARDGDLARKIRERHDLTPTAHAFAQELTPPASAR